MRKSSRSELVHAKPLSVVELQGDHGSDTENGSDTLSKHTTRHTRLLGRSIDDRVGCPRGRSVEVGCATRRGSTTVDECVAEALGACGEVSGSSGGWCASDTLLSTVEVGEARKVWSAIAAESTALDAVGSLNTAEVGSLASASDTADVAERSTNDGAAGCWDSTTVVVGVAEWHTWVTLATDTLVEATVDDGSGCVVSVVDLLAVVSTI